MKKFSLLLAVLLLAAAFSGCVETVTAVPSAEPAAPNEYDDGRARPSSCGKLRVVNGKLCSEDGEPVMLRGVSTNELTTAESSSTKRSLRNCRGTSASTCSGSPCTHTASA